MMNERPGAAMRLLYQLFVALNRMKAGTPLILCPQSVSSLSLSLSLSLSQKQELNRQSLEFTRSPGRMKLEKVETSIFQEVQQSPLYSGHLCVSVDRG